MVRALEEENQHQFPISTFIYMHELWHKHTKIQKNQQIHMQYFALVSESTFISYESTDHKIYSSNIICHEFINTLKEILVYFDYMMIGYFHDRNSQNMLKALFLMQCNLHIQS